MTNSTPQSNEAIERLRAHLERHKHRTGLYVSTDGLTALFDQLDAMRADDISVARSMIQLASQKDELGHSNDLLRMQVYELTAQANALKAERDELKDTADRIASRLKKLEKDIAEEREAWRLLIRQRDELKAQVERLLANEATRISETLVHPQWQR